MTINSTSNSEPVLAREIIDIQKTTCCIVGAGPAGAVLSLLLARQGVPTVLLEKHENFDREFRGDTLTPSVMEIMNELGLAEQLLHLPHIKMQDISLTQGKNSFTITDFSRLKTNYPYITRLSQKRFLEFITQEAKRYPNFQLVMGANVQELIQEDGVIRGVRYCRNGGIHEVRSTLTVGADGPFSQVRQLSGLEPTKTKIPSSTENILSCSFRLPRRSEDWENLVPNLGEHLRIRVPCGGGTITSVGGPVDDDDWLLLYFVHKSSIEQGEAGVKVLRQYTNELLPEFSDRLEYLQDWSQVSVFSVFPDNKTNHLLPRWYRPGLLLIGDAAHVMLPVGGMGIQCAIHDAVVAANVLGSPLKAGQVHLRDLATVQSEREWSTRVTHTFQALIQKLFVVRAVNSNQLLKPPFLFRLGLMRDFSTRLIAFGIKSVHVEV